MLNSRTLRRCYRHPQQHSCSLCFIIQHPWPPLVPRFQTQHAYKPVVDFIVVPIATTLASYVVARQREFDFMQTCSWLFSPTPL